MTPRINFETRDDTHPVEQKISIAVGGSVFTFDVVMPRYIARKLTPDDWMELGAGLRRDRDGIVGRSLMSGDYFAKDGIQRCRNLVAEAMSKAVYQRFQVKQVEAGEEAWAVPKTMYQGVAN
jgi:hypothetical protein